MAECSNTLEDADDTELLPQALVFKPCRKHVYGLLLLSGRDGNIHKSRLVTRPVVVFHSIFQSDRPALVLPGSSTDAPAVREWFVYPGNHLKEADMVEPVPVCLPSTCKCLGGCLCHFCLGWLDRFAQHCFQSRQVASPSFLPVWMCRWKAQPGLVVVRSWSWSPCSTSYLLPVYLWLPWLLQPLRKHWRLHVGCSLPCHLHRTAGSVTFLSDFFIFLFFVVEAVGVLNTKDRESQEVILSPKSNIFDKKIQQPCLMWTVTFQRRE